MSSAETDIRDLHPLEVKTLRALAGAEGPFREDDALQARTGLEAAHLRSALGWLKERGVLEVAEEESRDELTLGDLGEAYREARIPELRVFERLAEQPLAMKDLKGAFDLPPDVVGKAFGALKKAGCVTVDKGAATADPEADVAGFQALQALVERVGEAGSMLLDGLEPEAKALAEQHARRRGSGAVFRLATRTDRTWRLADQGLAQAVVDAGVTGDEASALTPEMLRDGSWRSQSFRAYNLSLPPARLQPGRKHPYMEFLDDLKRTLLSMGFTEMQGSLVETEFWNNDALFMPQFHSARDIHDVYFVKQPQAASEIEEPYATQVARALEDGWETGSKGWGYRFDAERTRRLILRSQGTACSSRQLANDPEIPGKYFAIARCFRYDQVDATHLSDFYQVEGIVLGEDIAFTHLLGLLDLFAREVAKADETVFAPAYFPFTEPSVELHARHPKLGWMELGGAGLFRPEVTRPLGVDVPVIAWGLGIDRMAMVALGVDDIRDLFSQDLERVRAMGGAGGAREEA